MLARSLAASLLSLSILLFATPTARAQDDAEKAPGKPVVKLTNPGEAPRTELRYSAEAKQTEQMVMDMSTSMAMKLGGANQPAMKMPTMRMIMDLEVAETKPNGQIVYDYELTKTEVLPTEGTNALIVNAMKQGLTGIAGTKGRETIDSRGFRIENTVEVPEGANAQVKASMEEMQSSLQQASAPFPAEAVGVGAVWTVTLPIETRGMKVDQVSTYTLKKIDGKTLHLDVEVKQSAKEQEIAIPNFGNLKAKLDTLESTGTGSMQVTLGKLVPVSDMTVKSNYTMSVQGQTIDTNLELAMKIHQEVPAEETEE